MLRRDVTAASPGGINSARFASVRFTDHDPVTFGFNLLRQFCLEPGKVGFPVGEFRRNGRIREQSRIFDDGVHFTGVQVKKCDMIVCRIISLNISRAFAMEGKVETCVLCVPAKAGNPGPVAAGFFVGGKTDQFLFFPIQTVDGADRFGRGKNQTAGIS